MTAYSESFAREEIHLQQARSNGVEMGASDPTPAVGALLQYTAKSIDAKSVVEIEIGRAHV